MAEQKVAMAAQDSGNPVLDSLVNMVCATGNFISGKPLNDLHKQLSKLANSEPGGLMRRSKEGTLIASDKRPKRSRKVTQANR